MRIAGAVLIVVAMFALGVDAVRWSVGGPFEPTSAAQVLDWAGPLFGLDAGTWRIDGDAARAVLSWPVVLWPALLGAALLQIGGRRRRRRRMAAIIPVHAIAAVATAADPPGVASLAAQSASPALEARLATDAARGPAPLQYAVTIGHSSTPMVVGSPTAGARTAANAATVPAVTPQPVSGTAGPAGRLATTAVATSVAKSVAKPISPVMPSLEDREFLSPALEILTTPASPVAMSLLMLICSAALCAVAWSYFGWLDIHAEAPGKIQPSGRTKVVQPLEAGRVVAIHIENGARVNAGDVLLELDPTETGADREAQARDLEAARAEASRRQAAIAAAATRDVTPERIAFAPIVGETMRKRESDVLVADLAQLRSTQASLQAQLAEKRATTQRLRSSIEARGRLLSLARERVDMREALDARGSGSRALIIESLVQYETLNTTDVGERGQLLETDAAINSIERKIAETVTQFVADQTQKLSEIERKRDRLVQELLKAQTKNDRTQMRAPIAGTVQQLTVTTVGQVVSSGQSLATIVPLDGLLEVEAMIANRDIGFVKAGQHAIVKIEAFPFTRYGAVDAEVVKISRDAVDDRDAPNMSDAATAARPQGGQSGPSTRTQNLVFPATLRLAQRSILVDGEQIGLTPGMAVTVEIKTGSRRAIDYVLSPLREVASKAGRER